VISALERLRQEDSKVETSLGYTERPCLNKGRVERKSWFLKVFQYKKKDIKINQLEGWGYSSEALGSIPSTTKEKRETKTLSLDVLKW
jgi:hypothetical protein